MRSSALVLAATFLTACFSPEVDPNASAQGSGSAGSSGGVGSSGVGLETSTTANETETSGDPDTTVGDTQTNTTDPNDAAPVVEAFTVNASTEPAEVSEGGTISLEADASDDVGVAGVEFFDGETSLGLVQDAPYELELLVSSADSGSHTYRAVATDTVGQTGESEEVTLSVNIVGGVIEILREELFRGYDFLTFANGGLDVAMDDRVFLTAIDAELEETRAMGFNDGLSQLWSRTYPELAPGAPVSVAGRLFMGATDNDALELSFRELSIEDGTEAAVLLLETSASSGSELANYGRVGRSGEHLVVNGSLLHMAAYPVDLSESTWLANLGAFNDITDYGQFTFVAFGDSAGPDCASGSKFCARRYDSDGQVNWTAGLGATEAPAWLAAHPDGGAYAVKGVDQPGYEVVRIHPDGSVEPLVTLGPDEGHHITSAHADGHGGLVVSGATGSYASGQAFVTRIAEDGAVLWDQRQFVGNGADSAALDVAVSGPSVFVYGTANNASNFLTFSGDAWVARLSL